MKHLPLNNSEFGRLCFEFDDFVKLKGYSRGKPTCYASNVREFLFFVENRGVDDIRKVRAADVVDYHQYLKERPNQRREGGLSESMIRSHLFSLRMFFDYLMDMGEVTASPAHLAKFKVVRHKQRQILTIDEIKEVMNACVNKMEKAILTIAYGCGLRRTEIEMLDVNDVIFSKGVLVVRDGKFGKSRTVPVSDKGLNILKEYLIQERPMRTPRGKRETSNSFFLNKVGGRLKGDDMGTMLKEIIQRTQNPVIVGKEITLHCLRHSIATHLLDNGAEIEFVQEFLGHSFMDTSQLYAKRRKQRLNIYDQINRPVYGH